jgi:non-ribosomal peptide synthetase component F
MISAGSVRHFLQSMRTRFAFTRDDRVAEPIELSFDLSVFNMFMTWNAGASLHLVPASQVMAPAKFIKQNRITVWFSIPSVITMMKRTKSLKPDSLPELRYSIFCGEPLPLSAVQSWREAAPNSIIDNLYGPTEATVACLQERVTDSPVVTPQRGIISIGDPIPGMEACIVNSNLQVLPPTQSGELAVSGPQLASGYFHAPDLTSLRFKEISGKRWYLTGDLAYQDEAGKFHHLGRLDHQVKILGYRVELEEIEAHLRDVSGTDLTAAVAWPVSNGTAEGIVGFVAKPIVPEQVRESLRKRLPSYMVPSSIRSLEHLPLSPNGKIDRNALIKLLNGEKL